MNTREKCIFQHTRGSSSIINTPVARLSHIRETRASRGVSCRTFDRMCDMIDQSINSFMLIGRCSITHTSESHAHAGPLLRRDATRGRRCDQHPIGSTVPTVSLQFREYRPTHCGCSGMTPSCSWASILMKRECRWRFKRTHGGAAMKLSHGLNTDETRTCGRSTASNMCQHLRVHDMLWCLPRQHHRGMPGTARLRID